MQVKISTIEILIIIAICIVIIVIHVNFLGVSSGELDPTLWTVSLPTRDLKLDTRLAEQVTAR
jgi:hypothetical protein